MTAGRLLFCALLFAATSDAFALGPFEKNDPRVQQGLNAYAQGKYDQALQFFDQAKKDPALKDSAAALDFNRGNALFKLGRMEDAKQAYNHALEADPGALREKDYYNLGNAFAQLGNKQEAVSAYRKALTLDPTDAAARHNLEVVLRDQKPPKQQGPGDGGMDGGQDGGHDGGRPDGGRDGGRDGGADGGRGDGGQGDGGQNKGRDGGSGDGGQGDGGRGQGAPSNQGGDGGTDGGVGDGGSAQGAHPEDHDGGTEASGEEGLEDGGTGEGRLNKGDVDRLLNAMKQSERNLQLWRFQQKKKQRKPNEKDW